VGTPFDTDENGAGIGVARGLMLVLALALVGVEYVAGPWACESYNPFSGEGGGPLVLAFFVLPVAASVLAAGATWPFGKLPALAVGAQVAIGAFAVGAISC
jgi:hypothetical protein